MTEILPAVYIQIGRLVSAERGKQVTLALAISATRSTVPPFFVFSGVHFRAFFFFLKNGSPVGRQGYAHPTGWMKAEHFL